MLDDLPLDPAIHERHGFECGVPALDEYLHRFAEQHRRRGISSVYVLTDSARPERILGYYTLSAAEVDGQRLTDAERKKLPRSLSGLGRRSENWPQRGQFLSGSPAHSHSYGPRSWQKMDRCGQFAADAPQVRQAPRYPVPCFRMGRLACRTDQRGNGLGKLLLGCAVDRCLKARHQVAAYALLVDAKDDVAKAFYVHFGFKALQDAPLTLYLPLGR